MTGVTATGIVIDRTTIASPEAVFAALTEAEAFAHWFGGPDVDVPADRLSFTAVTGEPWFATMVLPDGNTIDWAGHFVRVDPPHEFVFTLTDQPGADAVSDGVPVSVTIGPADGGAALHMTQETPDFPEEQKAATLDGWQLFFDEILTLAEAR
ncbi:Probable glutathione S-transferase-related transmembrane protein [Leucobacter sp. 7(1)]|uniref:SRPBCC family protein n=1 Tax=Leucobacter sp. 7(1) TaxID=1255613 RepID=UPI00097F37E4|nr:SRPBCC domain-containing protein [Leucobacter sp. 7(1)]SJN08388.1 Probable glutathione S-transferase-related transmembrane protein [Leucobacter sp. 7(1)]